MSSHFQKLRDYFAKLPGIGPRHATRIVLSLLSWPESQIEQLATSIGSLKTRVTYCQQCFNFADTALCAICANPQRDQSHIAVVEQITDLMAIEHTGAFRGSYHVLGGSINPAQGHLPSMLRIEELRSRLQNLQKQALKPEVILATNPNTHGETTALYLQEELKPLGVAITRLARGLASGSTVEYADALTLANALKDRR